LNYESCYLSFHCKRTNIERHWPKNEALSHPVFLGSWMISSGSGRRGMSAFLETAGCDGSLFRPGLLLRDVDDRLLSERLLVPSTGTLLFSFCAHPDIAWERM
jgi:hypothetical protein